MELRKEEIGRFEQVVIFITEFFQYAALPLISGYDYLVAVLEAEMPACFKKRNFLH